MIRIPLTLLLAAMPALHAGNTPASVPPVEDILQRLQKADAAQTAGLKSYTQTRRYSLENKRFNKTAEILVHMSYTAPDSKKFDIVSEKGVRVINSRVLRKMIEAEADATKGSSRRDTKITPANYSFALAGTDRYLDRQCYVLEVTPKTRNKYLVQGKVWVDAEDWAIVRIEGAPAKNPSIWTHNIHIVHEYRKFGPFWLAVSNRSSAEAMIFGKTDVTIDYSEIQVNQVSP